MENKITKEDLEKAVLKMIPAPKIYTDALIDICKHESIKDATLQDWKWSEEKIKARNLDELKYIYDLCKQSWQETLPDSNESIEQDKQEETNKEFVIESTIPFQIKISSQQYSCSYNNDLSNQMAAFIIVKNAIDKSTPPAGVKDASAKKQRTINLKISYELGTMIAGMGEVLYERVSKQQESDKQKEMAENSDIKIVKG